LFNDPLIHYSGRGMTYVHGPDGKHPYLTLEEKEIFNGKD